MAVPALQRFVFPGGGERRQRGVRLPVLACSRPADQSQDVCFADLLAEATRQVRVVVISNVVDFGALTRELARTDRAHAGVILIRSRTFRRSDVGGIARHLDALARSGRVLRNAVVYLSKREAGS